MRQWLQERNLDEQKANGNQMQNAKRMYTIYERCMKNLWNYDELYWIMYQRISEIEFKSIKWVAVRAKPGQSLHLSPGLQRRLQFCLPNSTGLPSGKREDAQGSGDRGAWAVGGFRGFMSYQVKIYQDLSRSIKSQIFRWMFQLHQLFHFFTFSLS